MSGSKKPRPSIRSTPVSPFVQQAGSVADFTDTSLPEPTAVERFLMNLSGPTPRPLPAGASYNPVQGVLDAILAGYPSPQPVGGTFNMENAVPRYYTPTAVPNTTADGIAAAAALLRGGGQRVLDAARRLSTWDY